MQAAPFQRDLDLMFARAVRVEVIDGGVSGDQPLGTEVLLSIESPAELHAFAGTMRIGGSGFHCMCLGDLAVAVYDDAGDRTAVLGLHHGSSIRWSGRWESDAVLVDGDILTDWLAERGVSKLADYRERSNAQSRESERRLNHWVAAAPAGFFEIAQKLAKSAAAGGGRANEETEAELRRLSATAFDNDRERAAALLAWFGAGSGKCSGYPSHESYPGELLLQLSTNTILGALEATNESAVQGALRLFAGWDFRKRVSELDDMDPSVRGVILAAAATTTDADKHKRAVRVFGPLPKPERP